ncbi:chemotaxis protein CheA [Heliobacterium chlorum]|uniref:Chemotaxis protein CheA n=1 Tax=Heliobacterium chlorum TaxID=2698 RepID=A0ABR7T4N0_HELCL|nr:chemotaxis protein CheA [Heliobacterium chlorum]MBC9785310.1 chemotaxis protein CheA [Heliobacterium chlorum]
MSGDNFMDEYMDLFYSEAKEQLDILSRDLLSIESGASNQEMIHEMFRAAHTLKGASAMVGLNNVTEITHKVEDLLGKVREGERVLGAKDIDTIFSALDFIQTSIFEPDGIDPAKMAELSAALETAMKQPAEQPVVPDTAERIEEARQRISALSQKVTEIQAVFTPDCFMKSVRAFLLTNNLKEFGEVLETVPTWQELEQNETAYGEVIIFFEWQRGSRDELERALNITDIQTVTIQKAVSRSVPEESHSEGQPAKEQDHAQEQQPQTERQQAHRPESTPVQPHHPETAEAKGAEYIKIEAKRLDLLMNLIGELLISQARFSRLQETYVEEHGHTPFAIEMAEETHQLSRVTTQLQDGLMKARMMPIGGVFSRYPRIVRDLAKKENKKITLVMEGQDTEMDKSVLDLIGDPLMHLIRNAVDHGIETPEERIQAGKPEEGTVRLRATHEGSRIVIQVADDGKGIDEQKVLAKARKLGLVRDDQSLSRQEIFDLLFAPGFSTAEKVTDVSGRGVGMDVVKRAISGLNGIIETQSEVGQGTTFSLQLPITLAIIQGLLVKVEGETMIIPLDNVLESFQLREGEVESIGGKEVFTVRGRVVPLLRLQSAMQIPRDSEKMRRKYRSVVMVGLAERRLGLEVDALLGKKEIVIKAIHAPWLNLDKFAGATILGDGRVSLILNIGSLFRRGEINRGD